MKINRILNVITGSGHLSVLLRDMLVQKENILSDGLHLQTTMGWLCRAQDAIEGQGISAGYDLRSGWLPPYPETTGYVITTFLDYYQQTSDNQFLDRAMQMGDWEIKIQMPDGAVRGGVGINNYSIVFNTGQVIDGWLSLFEVTKLEKYLSAAVKAGDWLVSVQDENGSWSKFDYNNVPHAYSSRVAWFLLKLGEIIGDTKYTKSGKKNINWILNQADPKIPWISHMGFEYGIEAPFTHTIAYTLQGLLESIPYLDSDVQDKVMELASRIGERLMHFYERRKHNPYALPAYLPAIIDNHWKAGARYSCLTGDAQVALVWLRLYQLNQDARFLNAALKMIDQVKALQSFNSPNPGITGGVAGSYPIYGGYMRFVYPNWAAKFFADALMLQSQIMSKLEA